jgi:hypothetical protein
MKREIYMAQAAAIAAAESRGADYRDEWRCPARNLHEGEEGEPERCNYHSDLETVSRDLIFAHDWTPPEVLSWLQSEPETSDELYEAYMAGIEWDYRI